MMVKAKGKKKIHDGIADYILSSNKLKRMKEDHEI